MQNLNARMSEGFICLVLTSGLGPGVEVGVLCGQGRQFRVPDVVSSWGSASLSWGGGGGSVPQEAGYWEPAASDFPARTWRGEDRGRWKTVPAAPRPRRLGPQASLRGSENRALGQGAHEWVAPPELLASCSSVKDSLGHPVLARSQRGGHLRDPKSQVPG